MSDPVWADTPEDTDYIADQQLDHQDRDTGWDEGDWPLGCGCPSTGHTPYCWIPDKEAAYDAANQRGAA